MFYYVAKESNERSSQSVTPVASEVNTQVVNLQGRFINEGQQIN